jgi:hypothetical protein
VQLFRHRPPPVRHRTSVVTCPSPKFHPPESWLRMNPEHFFAHHKGRNAVRRVIEELFAKAETCLAMLLNQIWP